MSVGKIYFELISAHCPTEEYTLQWLLVSRWNRMPVVLPVYR